MLKGEIVSAAFTVTSLDQHMQSLRTQAGLFHERFETAQRGFFTPSEDDSVTALWVSYHKARNALLELVQSIKQDVGEVSESAAAEFAIAYASALILVDAARFLRDLFSESTIVRTKLNEEFQLYGIPVGSFDAIQMSLTAPANALQIRAGNQFYEDHAAAIRHLAEESPQLKSVLAVIDRLVDRAHVDASRYIKGRIQDRRHRLNEAIVSGGLKRAVYAIQEWGSRFVSALSTKPSHVPRLPDSIAAQIQQLLKPGDVFVTRKEAALTNYFLPGYWPHVALYAGDGEVIESLKDGVRERTLESPFGNDAVCIIRPDFDASTISEALARARTHIGKPYDFDFDFTRADRMVCTEVVYRSYEGLDRLKFQLSKRAGRQTLAAEDLLRLAMQKKRFSVVAVFCPAHAQELLVDQRKEQVLAQTVASV